MEQIQEKKSMIRKKECWLSLGMVGLAYWYLSVIRYPTELARWIWWQAQLHTEYIRVGLAWMIFTCGFVGVGLWYTKACREERGNQLPRESWFYLILTMAGAVWFPFYMKGDQDILFYMILFLHGVAVYWLLVMTGSTRGVELDERSAWDLLRGFLVFPFSGFGKMLSLWLGALARIGKGENSQKPWMGRRGIQVILGVLISVPVLCLAIPILRGADVYFDRVAGSFLSGILDRLAEFEIGDVVWTGFWTLILASYFYGLFYETNRRGNAEPNDQLGNVHRSFPELGMMGFLIPILVLYGLFFVVRFAGVSGAMEQMETGDLWISTYAREGFFELCWIAAINFVIFTVVRWYAPSENKTLRGLIGGLGLETMAFVALAFSKMWYYIRAYGSFTFKRAMCCWLLLTLFVTFGLMTWELWDRKVKGVKWGAWFGCVTFLMMAYSNMSVWAP